MRARSLVGIGIGIGVLVAVCTAVAVVDKTALADTKSGTIGVSMPNIKGPWFTPVLFGISDEAKKLGYDVNIQDAGGYANVDKQVTQLSNLIVQKVKAFSWTRRIRALSTVQFARLRRPIFRSSAQAARSSPPASRATGQCRPAIAISAMSLRKAPKHCFPTADRSPFSPALRALSGLPIACAALRKT